ncbi:MAG: hypothetical protein K9M03_03345 [Kiritimatiellales bacterium]|nr:hypothetical protein [Kiritimatiellales bacterium]
MSDYKDDDFVYVDPRTKEVKGIVEWTKDGNAKPLLMEERKVDPEAENTEPKDKKPIINRKPRKQYYPWGSYRTMKKLYKLEGKEKEAERHQTLDGAIEKSLKEPFWD